MKVLVDSKKDMFCCPSGSQCSFVHKFPASCYFWTYIRGSRTVGTTRFVPSFPSDFSKNLNHGFLNRYPCQNIPYPSNGPPPCPPGFPDFPTVLGVGRRVQLLLNAQLMFLVLPAMNADYRPTLGSFFVCSSPGWLPCCQFLLLKDLLRKWT